jgi:hypothetical protein|tara:strand:+ start:6584 stop:6895 length:312 start_codon:yes stop_codon:yes gene_type:complete
MSEAFQSGWLVVKGGVKSLLADAVTKVEQLVDRGMDVIEAIRIVAKKDLAGDWGDVPEEASMNALLEMFADRHNIDLSEFQGEPVEPPEGGWKIPPKPGGEES